MKSNTVLRSVVSSLLLTLLTQTTAFSADFPEFDRGPDRKDPMQEELVELLQELPFLPGISEKLQVLTPSGRGQKMRPDFGAMPLRGFLQPNSISVLVIGQDGTHIAEGANRPGIAGFGGRVQDMLLHFGILEGVLFTNLYVNTISGQYGSRSTPVVVNGNAIDYQNVIENRQWLMTHEGPYGKWRNRFLSWVIRNNPKTLRMVMLLGQAGKDAGSNFINSIGGSVKPFKNVGTGAHLNVPVFKMVGAGGNNEFAVAVNAKGEDIAMVLSNDEAKRAALVKSLNANLKKEEDKLAATTNPAEKLSIETKIKIWKKRIAAGSKPINPDSSKAYKDGDAETGEGVTTYNAEWLISSFPQESISMMAFSNGGPLGNGVMRPQQFGGWDLSTMTVNGAKTRSIKGLQVPCNGSQVGECSGKTSITAPDVVFVGAPHPTSLSKNARTAAAKVENELMTPLKEQQTNFKWTPPQPEPGMESAFLKGKPYSYGRGVIPPSHGDPGITAMRLLPVSTAQRDGSSMIIIGTRNGVQFDSAKIKQMEEDKPSNGDLLTSKNVLTGRPKFDNWLYSFDRGPSQKYADLLFKSLKQQTVLMPKASEKTVYDGAYKKAVDAIIKKNGAGYKLNAEDVETCYLAGNNAVFNREIEIPETDKKTIVGIDGFNFKSHPEASFFGHYRGTFEGPHVVILADPHGYDSFITSKAATGARGQYLNGLMRDLKVDDKYLVLSTVPMMMDGATADEWKAVLASTQDYRTKLVTEVLKDSKPKLILADGVYAAAELKRLGVKGVIEIKQDAVPSTGIKEAGALITKLPAFKSAKISGARVDIPRSHLTWIARTWEGTSGDRVITATDKGNKGKAYAIVAPNWARLAKVNFTAENQKVVSDLVTMLAENGEPMPYENVVDFVVRRENCATLADKAKDPANRKADCGMQSPDMGDALPSEGAYK